MGGGGGGAGGGGSSPGGGDASTETPCGAPGTLDTAFGQAGALVAEAPKALTSQSIAAVGDGGEGAYVGYSPTDKVLPASTDSATMSVMHIDGTGKVDPAFGASGRADATYPNVVTLTGIRLGAVSGSLYLLGGSVEQSGQSTVDSDTIVRVSPSGAVDTSFGGDGHVQLGGPSGLPTNGYLNDLVERSDGSILVLTDGGFVHLGPTGQELDSAFASVFPSLQDSGYLHFMPAANDAIVIVGVWSGSNPTVARFSSSYVLDTTFGSGGQVAPAIGVGATAFSHAPRSDGGMYLGGDSQMASLDANGNLVPSFGSAGLAPVANQVVASLARTDGSVLYVPVPDPNGPSIAVDALVATGTPDPAFATAGSLSVPKSITRTDPAKTEVGAQYVGPIALLAVGTRRAFLVSVYGSNDATRNDDAFYSVYLARFCVE